MASFHQLAKALLAAGFLAAPSASAPVEAVEGLASQVAGLSWTLTPTGTRAQFRGLAPVSDQIAWVAGSQGTVLRTTDGGATWQSVGPELSEEDQTLEFRDIQAWSTTEAVILSIGEGTDSRVYTTSDGGESWTQTFANQEPTAFYNCIAFETPEHGFAVSDPVDGHFRLIETNDGGDTWEIVDPSGMVDALPGEFGFAASGTCISTAGGRWYLASGGIDPGRIFRSSDGLNWDVSNSSIAGGPAGGVFSVQFRDAKRGLAVGGDFTVPTGGLNNAAWSTDAGVTWVAAEKFPGGYRSGASWVPGLCHVALAVGPTGSDITLDGGKTWHGFDNGTFDSVECLDASSCWASGAGGRVGRLGFNLL
ncbi:oxidoreductase [Stachybotrys elegans]|uniref:Oxidoreductase n=1 Tax=Stachybotrys elegans TaxID=80388 RepID=A0A8K0SX96_9HYPO|nr:oxidoreductase [Stachybotrys elegans]